jgi:hypothetical protein
MATMTTKANAEAAYNDRIGQVSVLIGMLRESIKIHAEAFADDRANWGYVGDLGHVKSELVNLVASMTAQTPEAVAAIAEA